MNTVLGLMILIPWIAVILRFWIGVAKWLFRLQQTLCGRIERMQSAFGEGLQSEG